jgi:hypothetical protein
VSLGKLCVHTTNKGDRKENSTTGPSGKVGSQARHDKPDTGFERNYRNSA